MLKVEAGKSSSFSIGLGNTELQRVPTSLRVEFILTPCLAHHAGRGSSQLPSAIWQMFRGSKLA